MGSIIFLVLIALFYAAIIIPQQRKMKAQRALLASLEAGDEVVTTGGVHGAIVEVEGEIIWLEVAPEIELKVLRSAIAGKVAEPAEADPDVDSDAEADELVDDDR